MIKKNKPQQAPIGEANFNGLAARIYSGSE
jgi:hypothetical protein